MRKFLFAAALATMSGASLATPVQVDFGIYQPQDYGDSERGIFFGSWSFDDSIITPGAIFEDVFFGRPLDSFSFNWLGQQWDTGNARLSRIEFDAAGRLRSWAIGGTAVSGGCANVGFLDCVSAPSDFADFTLTAVRPEPGLPPPSLTAVGVLPGMDSFADAGGAFIVRRAREVPEPGTLGLFGAALLGLITLRRRTFSRR